MDNLEWLNASYKNAHSAKEIYPIVSGFRELFVQKDYSKIDDILAGIDLSKLSITAMVTFVATTSPARSKLKNWHSTIHLISGELTSQELDAKQILKGLLAD